MSYLTYKKIATPMQKYGMISSIEMKKGKRR